MSNQLEKLKNSIKKDYTKIFELDLMKTSGFIPVDKKEANLWVIINQENNPNKPKIVNLLKDKFKSLSPQFIPVNSESFGYLIEYVSQNIDKTQTQAQRQEEQELSPEEMLVSIGWLTKEQLKECLVDANEKKLPLDAIFHSKDYLSYEKIVSYLKKKYN